MINNRTQRRFGLGDLLGAIVFVLVGYAGLGRILHHSGRIAESTYNIGLSIVLICLAFILVTIFVVFR